MDSIDIIQWAARKVFKKQLFFLVKPTWVERNEPLKILDVGSELRPLLNRPGNEAGQYVLIGFEVPQRCPGRSMTDEK